MNTNSKANLNKSKVTNFFIRFSIKGRLKIRTRPMNRKIYIFQFEALINQKFAKVQLIEINTVHCITLILFRYIIADFCYQIFREFIIGKIN